MTTDSASGSQTRAHRLCRGVLPRLLSVVVSLGAMIIIRYVPEQNVAELACSFGVETMRETLEAVTEHTADSVAVSSKLVDLVLAEMCDAEPRLIWADLGQGRVGGRFGAPAPGIRPGQPPLHLVLYRLLRLFKAGMVYLTLPATVDGTDQHLFYGVVNAGSDGLPRLAVVDRDRLNDEGAGDDGGVEGRWMRRDRFFDPDTGALGEWKTQGRQYWPPDRPFYGQGVADTGGGGLWAGPYVYFSTGQVGMTYTKSARPGCGYPGLTVSVDLELDGLSAVLERARKAFMMGATGLAMADTAANEAAMYGRIKLSLLAPAKSSSEDEAAPVVQLAATKSATSSTAAETDVEAQAKTYGLAAGLVVSNASEVESARADCRRAMETRDAESRILLFHASVERPLSEASNSSQLFTLPHPGWTMVMAVPGEFFFEFIGVWDTQFRLYLAIFIPATLLIHALLWLAGPTCRPSSMTPLTVLSTGLTLLMLIVTFQGSTRAALRQLARINNGKAMGRIVRTQHRLATTTTEAVALASHILQVHHQALALTPYTAFDGDGVLTESDGFGRTWQRTVDSDIRQLYDLTQMVLRSINTYPNASFSFALEDRRQLLVPPSIHEATAWLRYGNETTPAMTATAGSAVAAATNDTTSTSGDGHNRGRNDFVHVHWPSESRAPDALRSFSSQGIPGGPAQAWAFWRAFATWWGNSGSELSLQPYWTPAENEEIMPPWLALVLGQPFNRSRHPVVSAVTTADTSPSSLSSLSAPPPGKGAGTGADPATAFTMWRFKSDLRHVQDMVLGGFWAEERSAQDIGAQCVLQADGKVLMSNRVLPEPLQLLSSVATHDDALMSRLYPEIVMRYPGMEQATDAGVFRRVTADLESSWKRIRVGVSVAGMSYIDLYVDRAMEGLCTGTTGKSCPWLLFEAVEGFQRPEHNPFHRVDIYTLVIASCAIAFAIYLDIALQTTAVENRARHDQNMATRKALEHKKSFGRVLRATSGLVSTTVSASMPPSPSLRRNHSKKFRVMTKSLAHAAAEYKLQQARCALRLAERRAKECHVRVRMEEDHHRIKQAVFATTETLRENFCIKEMSGRGGVSQLRGRRRQRSARTVGGGSRSEGAVAAGDRAGGHAGTGTSCRPGPEEDRGVVSDLRRHAAAAADAAMASEAEERAWATQQGRAKRLRGYQYIIDAYNGLSVLQVLYYERSGQHWRLRLYRLTKSSLYRLLTTVSVLVHLAVGFLEAPSPVLLMVSQNSSSDHTPASEPSVGTAWRNASGDGEQGDMGQAEAQQRLDQALTVSGLCILVHVIDAVLQLVGEGVFWIRVDLEEGQRTKLEHEQRHGRHLLKSALASARTALRRASTIRGRRSQGGAGSGGAVVVDAKEATSVDDMDEEGSRIHGRAHIISDGRFVQGRVGDEETQQFKPPRVMRRGGIKWGVVLWCILTALFAVDWVVQLTTQYNMSRMSRTVGGLAVGGRHEFWVLFSVTAPFRGFLLAVRSFRIRKVARIMMYTLGQATHIFVLILLLVTFMVVLSVLVLSRRYGELGTLRDFFDGFNNLFIYMVTAENYNEFVYPAIRCYAGGGSSGAEYHSGACESAIYLLLFGACNFLGMFYIGSLTLAIFQSIYTAASRNLETKYKEKKRLGTIAAFCVLDDDHNGELSFQEMKEFLHLPHLVRWKNFPKDEHGEIIMGLHEFVEMSEQLLPLIRAQHSAATIRACECCCAAFCRLDHDLDEEGGEHRRQRRQQQWWCSRWRGDGNGRQGTGAQGGGTPTFAGQSSGRGTRRERQDRAARPKGFIDRSRSALCLWLSSEGHRRGVLLTMMVYYSVMMLYGTVKDVAALDIISLSLLLVLLVEVGLRVYAHGFSNYWCQPNDHYLQITNRSDLVMTVGPFLLLLVFWAVDPPVVGGYGPLFRKWVHEEERSTSRTQDVRRLLLAVPLFRIFAVIDSIRPLFYGLLSIIPNYLGIFGLLGVVIYFYATIGVLLISTERLIRSVDGLAKQATLELVSNYDVHLRQANFNSMLDAWITLFQMFVGESWDAIMVAAVQVKGNTVALYFWSYIVLVTLLFGNLLTGVIIDSFNIVSKLSRSMGGLSTAEFLTALKEQELTSKCSFVKVTLPDENRQCVTVRRLGAAVPHQAAKRDMSWAVVHLGGRHDVQFAALKIQHVYRKHLECLRRDPSRRNFQQRRRSAFLKAMWIGSAERALDERQEPGQGPHHDPRQDPSHASGRGNSGPGRSSGLPPSPTTEEGEQKTGGGREAAVPSLQERVFRSAPATLPAVQDGTPSTHGFEMTLNPMPRRSSLEFL